MKDRGPARRRHGRPDNYSCPRASCWPPPAMPHTWPRQTQLIWSLRLLQPFRSFNPGDLAAQCRQGRPRPHGSAAALTAPPAGSELRRTSARTDLRSRCDCPAVHNPLIRWPPSTASTAPVMCRPAALASSNKGPSRSSGMPKRRVGMRARSFSPAGLARNSRFRSVVT